ncbi:MAG: hypothetical protein KF773_02985 [Deltaproteobacteria bacterium]|nr:hypothetical protein [Deltaproteobacteria bacterium]
MNVRLAAALLATLAMAPAARADGDPPFTIGSRARWFVLGGVTGGGTVNGDVSGRFLGGELSLARLNAGRYVGLYADAYYDFRMEGAYATGGVELGYKVVGLDGGIAQRFDGERRTGAAARLSLSAGVVALYVRYMYFPDAVMDDHVVQIGGMFKLPLAKPWGRR